MILGMDFTSDSEERTSEERYQLARRWANSSMSFLREPWVKLYREKGLQFLIDVRTYLKERISELREEDPAAPYEKIATFVHDLAGLTLVLDHATLHEIRHPGYEFTFGRARPLGAESLAMIVYDLPQWSLERIAPEILQLERDNWIYLRFQNLKRDRVGYEERLVQIARELGEKAHDEGWTVIDTPGVGAVVTAMKKLDSTDE